jgi:uncharacterized SAM-binding protein YcdF (DUF218 family)
MRRSQGSRSGFWLRLLAIVIALAFVWCSVIFHEVSSQSFVDEARKADVIVVFGAAEYYGRPSPIFRLRLDHAFDLYRRGFAPMVITTGGAAEDPRFNEGGVGRDYLVSRGIPDGDIIAETQSGDTMQSARRVANIMRTNGMHTALAVSDGYHIFRVKQMLRHEGIVAWGSPRPDSRQTNRWLRFKEKMREVFSYTAWRLGL